MFPLNAITYIKAGLFTVLLLGIFYAGWHTRDRDFTIYKDKVAIAQAVQEAKTKQITEQQKITTDRITNDYQTELARIHTLYSGLLLDSSTVGMSKPSGTLISINGFTADPVFAAQCTATTQQVVSLQEFIKEQLALK